MDKWESKKTFFTWIDNERLEAQKKAEKIQNEFNTTVTYDLQTLEGFYFIFSIAYSLDIDFIKKTISDDIFEYLKAYRIDLNLFNLSVFVRTIDDIDFFKKSKLSTDGKEYKREIEQLKTKADTLQFYSKDPIEIRLPILPHVSIYLMVEQLRKDGVSEKNIKLLNSFFDGRLRLPKLNNSIKAEKDKIQYAANFMSEALKQKIYSRQIETIVCEILDYYIPDINLSYHRGVTTEKNMR